MTLDATVLGIVLLGGSMFALGFLLCLAMIFVHSDEDEAADPTTAT